MRMLDECSEYTCMLTQNKPNVRTVPALTRVPLTDHKDSTDHNQKDFDYRHVIGKLQHPMILTQLDQGWDM